MWLWLIIAILLVAVGSYVLGTIDDNIDNKMGLFWVIVAVPCPWELA